MTDKLTNNGIVSDHPDVTMIDYIDLHGDPVIENDDVVIFSDGHGYELNEWADVLDMDRDELSQEMHELARTYDYASSGAGDPWAQNDPIVFNASTFDEVNND